MARPRRTNGFPFRSCGSSENHWVAPSKVPFMQFLRRDPSAVCPVIGPRSRVFAGKFGLLLAAVCATLALAGCDLFDSSKVENPVFGPPPPRTKKALSHKDDAAGADSAKAPGKRADADVARAQKDAPAVPDGWDDGIKTTAFSGSKDPASKDGRSGDRDSASTKIADNEVVAAVNGQPIFASEIFQRAAVDKLRPDGMNLFYATRELKAGRFSEREYRQLQEIAIRKYLKEYINQRLAVQAITANMEKEQKKKMLEALDKMYDEYIERLKKQMEVTARHEVEQKLREQGSSLASIRNEFQNKLLADEYVRTKAKKPRLVGRQEILAYYQQHIDEYTVPEKVRWQLLEVTFARHGGRDKALDVLGRAVEALRRGESFDQVARRYSDGSKAEQGGRQEWTRPESIAEEKTAAMLRNLPVGEISPVMTTREGFRMVRVIERRKAGRQSLAEVQDSIAQSLNEALQKEAVQEVFANLHKGADIETKYLTPDELEAPADYAGVSPEPQNRRNSSKNRRDRS